MFGKSLLLLGTAACLLSGAYAFAQNDTQNFYQDLLLSPELEKSDAASDAQDSAAQLLNKKVNVSVENQNSSEGENAAVKVQTRQQMFTQLSQAYGQAPEGLIWGISAEDIEKLGVSLTPTEVKDYPHAYIAQNVPTPIKDFSKTTLFFGDENKLFRILMASDFISDDTPNATKTLKLYNKYYNLLKQKYKNAQQFFTPNASDVDVTPNQNTEINPQDYPDLLKNLLSGNADLYATFEGDGIGAALAVNVDGNSQTYITIDYRNLKILKENELNLLQAL